MKRILVYGMGGIGGYIGARLATAASARGFDLAFVARGSHLEAIAANGLRYRAPDGCEIVARPAAAVNDPASVGKVDFVFICVKGYDLEAACRALEPALKADTVVIPLLNGADIYERVRALLGTAIVLPSCIYISSSIAEPGLVSHTGGMGNLVIGREPGRADFDPAPLRSILEAAAVPYEWFEDPFPALWTKYLFIASFGLVTGMSGKSILGVATDPDLFALVRGIQNEIVAVARAKGVVLAPDAVEVALARGKTFPPAATTSFQRDLAVGGKPNEGDLFGGAVIELGRKYGVPTPTTEKVYSAIRRPGL